MMSSLETSMIALAIVVMVLVIVAIPFALVESYGIKVKKPLFLFDGMLLAVVSFAILIWWTIRYKKTSRRIDELREEIKETILLCKTNVHTNV